MGKEIAVTISPGCRTVFPGPVKKECSHSVLWPLALKYVQFGAQHDAGAGGIAGRRGIADIADDGGPGAQLIAGYRVGGFRQQGVMLVYLGRGDHTVHINCRANRQALSGIEFDAIHPVEVFYVHQKFRRPEAVAHAYKAICTA